MKCVNCPSELIFAHKFATCYKCKIHYYRIRCAKSKYDDIERLSHIEFCKSGGRIKYSLWFNWSGKSSHFILSYYDDNSIYHRILEGNMRDHSMNDILLFKIRHEKLVVFT